MNAGDWIQLFLAIIAAIGAILAFMNIYVSKKAIELQQRQWEHSAVPVYRIDYITIAHNGPLFVLDNTNEVAHQVEAITFSVDQVAIEFSFNGYVEKTKTKQGEKETTGIHKGLVVKLVNKSEEYICGYLQLKGKDSLGNEFRLNTNLIEFESSRIKNDLVLSQTYLYKA